MSIILDKINYSYSEGTAYQIQALKNVNLEIKDGQFIGVIGHTGRKVYIDTVAEWTVKSYQRSYICRW